MSAKASTLREGRLDEAGVQPLLGEARCSKSKELEEEDQAERYHVGLRKRGKSGRETRWHQANKGVVVESTKFARVSIQGPTVRLAPARAFERRRSWDR